MPDGGCFADQLIALKVFTRMLLTVAERRKAEDHPHPVSWSHVLACLADSIEDLECAWETVDDQGLK